VKDISLPAVLQKYAERTSQMTNVPLNTDIAC